MRNDKSIPSVISGKIYMIPSKLEGFHKDNIDVSIEKERARLSAQKALANLENLYGQNWHSMTTVEQEIYKTQIYLLKSDEVLYDIYQKIDESNLCAEQAVRSVIDDYRLIFSNIQDEDLKTRLSDIEGICDYLICIMSDISHDDLDQIILVSEFIPPYFLMEHMDKIKGCVSHVGSEYSHVGLICKARQIPYLVAINIDSNWNGQNGQIDLRNEIFRVGKEASKGKLISPTFQNVNNVKKTRRTDIGVKANISSSDDLSKKNLELASGIGLVRSEFFLLEAGRILSVEEQVRIYRKISNINPKLYVNIRLFDLGDEKALPFLKDDSSEKKECRGIRFLLENGPLLLDQIEAILIANDNNNLRILVPFITKVREIRLVKKYIQQVLIKLHNQGHKVRDIQVGAMIETPAAVILTDEISREIDFISIGTNDLLHTLYVVDRMDIHAKDHIDEECIALINAIQYVVKVAHSHNIRVSVCGELACQDTWINRLVSMGVDEISVPLEEIDRILYL